MDHRRAGVGQHVAVLLADVSGSTPFYEAAGNEAAARAVRRVIDRLRATVAAGGGVFVSAKGDDVLCRFADPEAALAVAREMLGEGGAEGLSVHAGLQWGEVVSLDDDIFGQAVNTAARLCAVAKGGELVVALDLYDRLAPGSRAGLVEVKPVLLKGMSSPMRLFSYQLRDGGEVTEVVALDAPAASGAPVEAMLEWGGAEWHLSDLQSLTVGRAPDSDIRVDGASVSRRHGTVRVANGLVEYSDHSSTGSFVRTADGQELEVFRRLVTLSGEGSISLGAQADEADRPPIRFRVRGAER